MTLTPVVPEIVDDFVPLVNPWRRTRTWEGLAEIAVHHHVYEDPDELPGITHATRLVAVPSEGEEALLRAARAGLFPLRVYPVAGELDEGTIQRAAVTFLAPLPAYSALRSHLMASPLLLLSDPDTPTIAVTVENGAAVDTIRKTSDELVESFKEEWQPLLHKDVYRHLSHARWVHVIDMDPNEPLRLWEWLETIPLKNS